MICPNCNYNNKEGSRFCKECGHPLSEQTNTSKQSQKPVFNKDNYMEQERPPFEQAQADGSNSSLKRYLTIGGIVAAVVLLGLGIFFGVSQLKNYKTEQDKIADAALEKEKEKAQKEGAAKQAQLDQEKESEQQETSKSKETQESEPAPAKNYTVISEDLPVFSARPIYVGNGHYIYQSNGKYGVIDSNGQVQASDYDAYALREISQTEKQYVDFVGYACVYNEPAETGIDAIELQPCDKNETFPWVQDYAPRVISSSGIVKDLDAGTANSGNSSLYRTMQETMVYTIVDEDTYNSTGNQDVVPYSLYSEATETLFGPYEAGEHAFFELKPRLVRTNYFCDTIFYARENGQYRIYNQDATESYPELFDYAEPVSDEYMMVQLDGKTGLIDTNFNLVFVDDATDITGADNGRTYALIDGNWKLIEMNE